MTDVSYRNFTGTGAENYQRFFVPSIATPVSAHLLERADIQPAERVVDVACGTGVIARLAAPLVGPAGSVTGIDFAADMLDVARATPAPVGPEIEWREGDATAIPLADESYDVALCQMGLMFMADRNAAVSEMHRILTPGGRVVVNTPGAIQPAFQIMEQAIVEHISPELGGFVGAVFSMHDPETVRSLLDDVGFDDVAAEVTTTSLRLPPPAEFLWQYIHLTPMGPFVAQATATAQSALERQVVEGWRPYVVDGATLVEQPMVTARGRR